MRPQDQHEESGHNDDGHSHVVKHKKGTVSIPKNDYTVTPRTELVSDVRRQCLAARESHTTLTPKLWRSISYLTALSTSSSSFLNASSLSS